MSSCSCKSSNCSCCSSEKVTDKPLVVTITGAAGQICYNLVFSIANGDAFGKDQKLDLRLLDLDFAMKALDAVVMELEDCNFENVVNITATSKPELAFKDSDCCVLVGAFPRREGMTRADLLKINSGIFTIQGKQIADNAKPTCKVLVVGNPANTNALNCMKSAQPKIPKENFTALTRLDQNRACGFISRKTGVKRGDIRNMIIWGNHSATQFPDLSNSFVQNYPSKGVSTPVSSLITDPEWITSTFIPEVQLRGKKVIAARGKSSAASASRAICQHLRDWMLGSDGRVVSMGVYSNGEYGTPKGLIYSMPVICKLGGSFTVVKGFKFTKDEQSRLDKNSAELTTESNFKPDPKT